jgi:hypothetical protein
MIFRHDAEGLLIIDRTRTLKNFRLVFLPKFCFGGSSAHLGSDFRCSGSGSIPGGSMSSKQRLFQHTLLNVGSSCYFNSVLQVVASLPSFVLAIENNPKTKIMQTAHTVKHS